MNDNPRVRVEVPCLHDDENDILFVWVLFVHMLAQSWFLLFVFKILCFYVVREIFAMEDAVSFNFALGAPLVKRRVKSSRPSSAAPIDVVLLFNRVFLFKNCEIYSGIYC